MNDKELLELAAKGAGYAVVWNDNWNCFQHKNPVPDKFGSCRHPWVPLEDDGDALRLATELDLNIYHAASSVFVEDLDEGVEIAVGHEQDKIAATRRAIVMAAAQIGETMP